MKFEDVQDFLSLLPFRVEASEFHGQLTALVCSGYEEEGVDDWLPAMLTGGYISDKVYDPLSEQVVSFCRDMRGEFEEDGFNFQVLLPGDDDSLHDRVENLSRWCVGFLEGLDLAGSIPDKSLPRECREVIDDISSIAYVEVDPEESLDEQEFAFETVSEHVRTAVQLYYEYSAINLNRTFEVTDREAQAT